MNEKINKKIGFLVDIAYLAVVVLLVYLTFKYVFSWILPFILAFCIVSILQPLINWIKKRLHFKREIVAILIMVLIYLAFGTVIVYGFIYLFGLAKDIFTNLPVKFNTVIYPSLLNIIDTVSKTLNELPFSELFQFEDFQYNITESLKTIVIDGSQKVLLSLTKFTNKVPSFFITLIFTIMLSFFISIQYDRIKIFIKTYLPKKTQEFTIEIKSVFKDTILKYIKAYMILMFITFIELSIGFLILKVDGSIFSALGIAIFDALPFFGTGAIVIPWIIIELIQGNYSFAVGLLILYGVITLVRNIIEPKVVGDQLGLNPIISLMSIYFGLKLFGVLGMIFMPILVQIISALHKNGKIKIFGK